MPDQGLRVLFGSISQTWLDNSPHGIGKEPFRDESPAPQGQHY